MCVFLNGKLMRWVPQGVNTRAYKREKIKVCVRNSSLESEILQGRGSSSKQYEKAIIFKIWECFFIRMVCMIFLFSGVSNLLNCHKGFEKPICQKEVGEVQVCTGAPYHISPSSSNIQPEPVLFRVWFRCWCRGAAISCSLCSVGQCSQLWGPLHSQPSNSEQQIQTPTSPWRGCRAELLQSWAAERGSLSLEHSPALLSWQRTPPVPGQSETAHQRYQHPHLVSSKLLCH